MPARKQSIGLVTGPRPGLAICSFTEGIVETVLRCLVAVSQLMNSCCSVISFSLQTGCVCAVGVWCSVAVLTANYPATSSSIASGDNATLPLIVYKSTTLGLTAGGVGITWEVAVIVLRFLNIGILNMMSRVFLSTVSDCCFCQMWYVSQCSIGCGYFTELSGSS